MSIEKELSHIDKFVIKGQYEKALLEVEGMENIVDTELLGFVSEKAGLLTHEAYEGLMKIAGIGAIEAHILADKKFLKNLAAISEERTAETYNALYEMNRILVRLSTWKDSVTKRNSRVKSGR